MKGEDKMQKRRYEFDIGPKFACEHGDHVERIIGELSHRRTRAYYDYIHRG